MSYNTSRALANNNKYKLYRKEITIQVPVFTIKPRSNILN